MEPARQIETESAYKGRISFFIPGIPAPAGSKKAFFNPRNPHKPIVTDDSKRSRPWKSMVASFALEHAPTPIFSGPLSLDLLFIFPRPKNHYGTGRNSTVLKKLAPDYHTIKPDLTKLIRAVEDALTGIIWRDDALICWQTAHKIYTVTDHSKPGVYIVILNL